MNTFRTTLIGLSFIAGCACVTTAQEKPGGSIPKVLQITREYTKPGKAGTVHEKAESAFVQAMARAKWPTHYIGMTSLTGKQRALFLTRYESFEAWEKDNQNVAKNAVLAAGLDRAGAADGELLSDMDQAVFYFREEMSLRPLSDISHTRFLDVMVFHVRTGKNKEWQELVKLAKEAYGKADPEAHWGMFELAFGGDNGTFLLLTARKTLAEVDRGFMMEKQLATTMGEEGMKKMDELYGASVDSSQTQLFAYNPNMSYVEDEWIKSDPDFWKPKSATTMAAKAATQDKKAKQQ
jgi:hypothetical protein